MSLRAVSLLIFALASIVITSAIIPAFAVQVDTLMIPKRGKADVFYKSVNIFYFEFPNGGKLQSLLQNVDDQIAFTADKDTPGVTELIIKINNNLVNQKNSPVIVEDIKVDYKAKLKGQEKRSVLEHNLKMDIVISDFVMFTGSSSEGTLIDLNWRGLYVDEPIVLTTEEYGDFDINFPSGYYYARHPGLMEDVEKTAAMDILGKPTIDLRELTDLPIDKWAWLFDPSGSIKESERFGFTEVGGANLITFFAYGESNVETGVLRERTTKVDFAIDGIDYEMRSTSPSSNASIQIAGYATESIQGSDEGALVFEFVPEGAGKSYTGGFPIVVLAVLGGMMGAVAVFVLWRANKK